MGPASKPVWLGQLELRVFFFFFPPEALSVAVTGGAVLLRPRGRDGPGFQAGVARPAGASGLFFFFSSRSLVCRCHRGRCTSEAERTRWARLPSRCGGASWSFGFFFFFLQKPSLVPVTGGAVLLRPRGRDGPVFQADVARSAGALDLFFFSSRSPLLSPSPGAPYI